MDQVIKKVSLCNQKTIMTAFDYDTKDLERMHMFDDNNAEAQVDSGIFGISKGSRFDHKNHHWLLFDDYISLSFSYMSFIIKDKLERSEGHIVKHIFDPEAYNYLFNKRTSFMDSEFTRVDTTEMPYVLESLEKKGQAFLGILNYSRQKNITSD
jgi:hypothetical protein